MISGVAWLNKKHGWRRVMSHSSSCKGVKALCRKPWTTVRRLLTWHVDFNSSSRQEAVPSRCRSCRRFRVWRAWKEEAHEAMAVVRANECMLW
eukprot:364519-Chlamydomonas_euryale.AAC.3